MLHGCFDIFVSSDVKVEKINFSVFCLYVYACTYMYLFACVYRHECMLTIILGLPFQPLLFCSAELVTNSLQ